MSGRRSSLDRTIAPELDPDIGDLARFLVWLAQAAQAEEAGLPWPGAPACHDRTVARWTQMITGLAACAERVDARLRRAEGAVDQLAARLGDQTLQLAEQLAAVYEWSGRPDEAQGVRMAAAGLSLRPPSGLTSSDPRSGPAP